ncbi:MAG: DUF692 domain-containing protein [Gammaproteobacteria bacterium]|nr:DUF692 domain-containing protein [Gammaproteobacteria bacterium]
MSRFISTPIENTGIGLRAQHYRDILEKKPDIPWFEVLSENYLSAGGLALHHLEQIRERYPVTLHGVGMSLGSTDPLNRDYLKKLKSLAERIEPAWISDHLAWISADGHYVHDLLPLPYTEEALNNFAARVDEVQEYLGCQLLIENPSSYMSFTESDLTEWEFLNELTRKTDCNLLLDVNNLYVCSQNLSFDPVLYLEALSEGRVKEIHLAGYEAQDNFLFDTHGQRVHPPVWELYEKTVNHLGPIPTLIEWDTDIPAFDVLTEEAGKAQQILNAGSLHD